tara:strand:+ start:717 stop:911 length:195 start_codon:yes stop_codon:yes gene_type:complete
MTIDPEVIPSSSSAGDHAIRLIPKWLVYGVIALGVLFLVSLLKMLLPIILMTLLLGFIWKQANN